MTSSSHQPPIVRFFDDELPPDELVQPRPINWWAIGAMAGAVCCMPGLSLVALMLGMVGIVWHRRRVKADKPPPRLTLLAWFGVTISIVMTLLWTALLVPASLLNSRMETVSAFSRATMISLAAGDDVSTRFTPDALADAKLATADWQNEGTIQGGRVRTDVGADIDFDDVGQLAELLGKVYSGPWNDEPRIVLIDRNGANATVRPEIVIEKSEGGFIITSFKWDGNYRRALGSTTQPATQPATQPGIQPATQPSTQPDE